MFKFRAKFVHNERRSVGPADRERERVVVDETIERQRRVQQQQQVIPLLNGASQQQTPVNDDNMVGYIGTSERRYIQAGSIPTLTTESARLRSQDDSSDDFCTGGVSCLNVYYILLSYL